MDLEERSDQSGSSSDEVSASEESVDIDWSAIEQFIQSNQTSTNTKLFSYLALLNAYVPDSYLVMSECQQILGPPGPIHRGSPFEERMGPFRTLISRRGNDADKVCLVNNEVAKHALTILQRFRISKFGTAESLINSLCGDETQPQTTEFIKYLLTKRVNKPMKSQFSKFIDEIGVDQAEKILKTATEKFSLPLYPQTLSRLLYRNSRYKDAVIYAEEAIRRAPNSSFMADTLGQVYKNWLLRGAPAVNETRMIARNALNAFRDVEEKAEREEGLEITDSDYLFSNRGLFGFMQVAKIIHEKLPNLKTQLVHVQEIEEKFNFFEWYLTYSRLNMSTYEPDYFWQSVVQCYKYYTDNTASESTTFPGLLECLNHELFQSRGQRAQLKPKIPDLEAVQTELKLKYEGQTDDIKAAERYILSNILLCNQTPDSPQLAPLEELRQITTTFMRETLEARNPQFYLLVLLLFWPENQSHSDLEEDNSENEVSSQDSGSQRRNEHQSYDEEVTDGESEEVSLQNEVANMEKSFERVRYAKYLRGRYLLPLFFLGKGVGLRRWIHKSKLDAIVEDKVNTEIPNVGTEDQTVKINEQKLKRISEIWSTGEVWHIPAIKNILEPVNVEPSASSSTTQEQDELVWVQAGRERIKARTEEQPDASDQSPICYYLGFNIQGPVVFKVHHKSEN